MTNAPRPIRLCGKFFAAVAATWCGVAGAASYGIGACATSYPQCLTEWKAARLEQLKSDDGYLNLAGLFWLRPGTSTFGSNPGNDIVFPTPAAPAIGAFDLTNGVVEMSVLPGVDVRIAGSAAERVTMVDDSDPQPTVASHGSFAWSVIRRADRFAVRLRDFAHPALHAFAPIEYFPADEALRISAQLDRYETPRIVRVDTVIEGLDYLPSSPGVLRFDIAGQQFELEAYDAGQELLIVFGDTSTGRDTYPAGRFLYADKPGPDGLTMLDFNTAQNPPCAFNEFATCPVAAPGNRLKIRIEAGERFEASGH